MDAERLPKSVKEIVQLHSDGSGALSATTIFTRRSTNRPKGSFWLRPMERAVHNMADASATLAQEYVRGHQRSNLKRRDGWVRDVNANMMRSVVQGAKRLKITRLLMPF